MAGLRVKPIEKGDLVTCSEDWQRVLATDSLATIFDTWEWFAAFSRHHEKLDYHVLSVTDGSKTIAFAPLVRRPSNRMGFRIWKIGFPSGLADYNSIIASDETRPKCYETILNYFLNEYRDWDLLDFDDLPAWSSFTPYLAGALKTRCQVAQTSVCPYVKIRDWQSYLASRPEHEGKHIKKELRMVDEPGLLEFRTSDSPESLGNDMRDFLRLHLLRKPDSPLQIESNRDFLVDVAHAFLRRGWLDLTFLSQRGELRSVSLGFKFRGRYYAYNRGLNTEVKKLKKEGFGHIHLSNLVRRAFESGLEEFDLLRGEDKYKYVWTDTFRRNSRISTWNTKPSSAFYGALEKAGRNHPSVERFVRVLSLPLRLSSR